MWPSMHFHSGLPTSRPCFNSRRSLSEPELPMSEKLLGISLTYNQGPQLAALPAQEVFNIRTFILPRATPCASLPRFRLSRAKNRVP